MVKKKFTSMEEVMAAWKRYAGEEDRRELPWHLGAGHFSMLLTAKATGEQGALIHAHLADCQHCCNELAGLTVAAERPAVSYTLRRQILLAAADTDEEKKAGEKFLRYETEGGDFQVELELEAEKGEAHIQLRVLNPAQEEELNGKLVIIKKPDGSNVGVTRVRSGVAFLEVKLDAVKDNVEDLIIVPSEKGSSE